MGSKVEVIKDESLNCRKLNSPQNNEEEEEDEDDDGPPPGFDSLPLNLSTDIKHIKNEKKEESFHQEQDDDDDDDGPPPGFQSISLKDTKKDVKNESFIENIDDIDGPPPGFHSIIVVEPEKGDGLNPNSQSDLKILGDGSKLGFESIHVRNSGNGLNPIYQSDFKKVDECELGLRSVSVKEDGKSGNGLQSGLGLFNLEKCELGLQSNSEKGEEKIIDGSEEPELGLQSISEKGKENGEEKIGDGSELGFESVSNKEKVKEVNESEFGSQPLPMIEDEKEDNVRRTGLQSISQKVGIEEKNDDKDDDEGPPPGWGSFPLPRPPIESPAPPHHPRSSVSPRPGSGSAHVRNEERVRDELEVGSQLDPMKEYGKEDDGSELKSQSFPTEEKGSTSVKEEEDDNEGPPPGWFSCHPSKGPNKAPSSPKLPPLIPAQLDPMKEDEKERDGSELESLSFPVKTEEKRSTPVKEVEDDEGPPPGWYSCHPSKGPCKALSPLTPAPPNPLPTATSSDEKGSTPVNEKDNEALPPGWYSCHPSKARSKAMSPPQLPPLTPAPPNPQPSVTSSEEKGSTPVKEKDDEGPPPGWYSCHPSKARSKALSPPQLLPLSPAPPNRQPSATSGKAQMVCGSCRTLLSYSEGSRFVQCSCCQTVNLVLEEHQVGQVKCRGCTLLLMYPYGAPSVQCSSCLFVTKVGVQNQRPPLSMQQGRPQLLANPVT